MAARFHRRRIAVAAIVAVAGLVAALAGDVLLAAPALASGPAPFPLPLDAGTRAVSDLSDARHDLATARPAIHPAQTRVRELQARFDDLTARVAVLEQQERASAAQVRTARTMLAEVAAKQYVEAGGTRVNAAIEVALDADNFLDLSRNLHIL